MKKILAVVLFSLSVSPLLADNAAPAAAAPAAAAPAAAAPADNAAPAAPKAKKAKTGDEAGIKKTFKEWGEAWAAGDAKALAALFVGDEPTLIIPMGDEATGRAEIEKTLAAGLDTMKGSTHSVDGYKFRFVLPGFALVDATGTISGLKAADGTAAPDVVAHIYAALALRGSKWQFIALRVFNAGKGAMTAAAAPAPAQAAAPPAAAPAAPAAAAPAAPAPAVNVPVPASK